MSAPVIISRIQNRRGTQSQFDNLYPVGYAGTGGFGGFTNPSTATTGTSGTGTVATVEVSFLPAGIVVGTQITVAGITPTAYNGTFIVTAYTSGSVSYAATATGSQIVAGTITVPYTSINYPNVLMPGELALCTDSRNIFLGNLNGEYLTLSESSAAGLALTPLVITLDPVATFTIIPALTYAGTPFSTLFYDITDASGFNWNTVGTNFTRNGQLQISVISDSPNPPIATLTDVSTEINNLSPQEIIFEASYNGSNIEILYMSTFTIPLTFSTSTLQWLPF